MRSNILASTYVLKSHSYTDSSLPYNCTRYKTHQRVFSKDERAVTAKTTILRFQIQYTRPIALRAISPLMSFSIPTPTKPPSPGPFGKSGGTAPARKASFCLCTYARFCGVFGIAGMYITACGTIRISDERRELKMANLKNRSAPCAPAQRCGRRRSARIPCRPDLQ